MNENKSEGILLKVVAYQDFHEIATLFGPEGIINVIRKWGRSKKKSPLQPLKRVEIVWTRGRGELGTVQEVSELDPYNRLRDRYETLECALKCLEAVKKTQTGEQESPELYALLRGTLEKMGEAPQPKTLLCTFYLKLLLHEGLLSEEKLTPLMQELVLSRSWSHLLSLSVPDATYAAIESLFFDSIS